MDQYSNSHKVKTERDAKTRKIEKVVSGKVKTQKTGELHKFTDLFIAEDLRTVVTYVIKDVIIPEAKKIVREIMVSGTDMMLFGESRGKKTSVSDRVSYRRYYDRDDDRTKRDEIVRDRFRFDNIILDNRGDAEKALYVMDDILEEYGMVRVADFYELVGITGDYTDNNYGWDNLRNATVIHTRDGWTFRFPKVKPLNR